MKTIIYYFRILFKNTKYLSLCTILLIASIIFTTVYFRNTNTIDSSFLPFTELFPFFLNPTNRIYFVLLINIMPLLVSIPIADILKLENKCKYNILTRKNKHINVLSKIIVSFFCGFSMVFIILASNVLFSNIILNQGTQDFYYYLNFFVPNNEHIMTITIPFYNLLLSDPFVFSILYVILLSTLGGCLSLVTLSIGLNINSILVIYCLTFIFVFSGNILTFIVPGIVDVFDPIYVVGNNFVYILGYFLFFIVIIIIGIINYVKRDVY